ncbi:hypothetical protein IHE45_16G015700 [Dioscorea alata]|uniref:Uncharacterized protein n=1 Tax=Dioscorea alata TaxID=55571 RepID=A0ACB7UG01_DIOAL|nr:hypothetical protein IHE45_16G015700 [Dioscorea alata]
MANLGAIMDSEFSDLHLSSPQVLDGVVRCVPGDPAPPALARAPRTIRPQQLSLLSQAFPLGLIPSLSPSSQKGLGSFAIQSFIHGPFSDNWWSALAWQFRPMKLISSIKKEFTVGDELELPAFKDIAKHILDKSLYAFGFFSQISPTPDSSLLLNFEKHGDREGHRSKAVFIHKLPNHDITLEAASPDLFLGSNGIYWNVPNSISLDVASLVSNSGFKYRFGLHRNGGSAEAHDSSLSIDTPLALMPGMCAKAAFSFEKSKDIWREREKKSSKSRRENVPIPLPSYDIRLKEPHAAVSGIIGAACAAWFEGNKSLKGTSKAQSFSADLFGSISYTLQHGKFKDDFNDLTRIDARLDIRSAKAFINEAGHLAYGIFKGPADREVNPLAAPQLNLIFQQQVAGPIVFRVDSRVSLMHGKQKPQVEDIMYGLSYSFRLLQSGKVLAWYSPKRKEAMVELRFFEF